jgi:hypothetical protein
MTREAETAALGQWLVGGVAVSGGAARPPLRFHNVSSQPWIPTNSARFRMRDGSSSGKGASLGRAIHLDNLTIAFKQTAPSKRYWSGRPLLRVVQALHWLRDTLPADRQLHPRSSAAARASRGLAPS